MRLFLKVAAPAVLVFSQAGHAHENCFDYIVGRLVAQRQVANKNCAPYEKEIEVDLMPERVLYGTQSEQFTAYLCQEGGFDEFAKVTDADGPIFSPVMRSLFVIRKAGEKKAIEEHIEVFQDRNGEDAVCPNSPSPMIDRFHLNPHAIPVGASKNLYMTHVSNAMRMALERSHCFAFANGSAYRANGIYIDEIKDALERQPKTN